MKVKEIIKNEGLMKNVCKNSYCKACPLVIDMEKRLCCHSNFVLALSDKGILSNDFLEKDIALGEFEPKVQILDEAEKNYLKAVIAPFKNRVNFIAKQCVFREKVYIYIALNSLYDEGISLPSFEEGTMYNGMEMGVHYTLKELELDE